MDTRTHKVFNPYKKHHVLSGPRCTFLALPTNLALRTVIQRKRLTENTKPIASGNPTKYENAGY